MGGRELQERRKVNVPLTVSPMAMGRSSSTSRDCTCDAADAAASSLDSGVALSPRGEIEVDYRGETTIPGVFAAGDATVTPYKQIIIAMGEGAKASLSAFDYLIRLPAEAAAEAA